MDPLILFSLVILLLLSVPMIVWPKEIWHITEGWKYKNVEPSDAALFANRVIGVLGVIFVAGMGIALITLW